MRKTYLYCRAFAKNSVSTVTWIVYPFGSLWPFFSNGRFVSSDKNCLILFLFFDHVAIIELLSDYPDRLPVFSLADRGSN